MTEHAPTRRRHASTSDARPPRADVPSTIWACGPEPIDPTTSWPAPIVTRAVTEFSKPGDRVLVPTSPAPTAGKRRRFLTPSTESALTAIDSLGRHSAIEYLNNRPGSSRTSAPREADEVELVLATLLASDDMEPSVVDEIVTLAAARLAPGGVLAVFTRATHTRDGVLLDATGPTVAAGQTADLLFLQHIVAVPITDSAIPTHLSAAGHIHKHAIAHTDITVLLRP